MFSFILRCQKVAAEVLFPVGVGVVIVDVILVVSVIAYTDIQLQGAPQSAAGLYPTFKIFYYWKIKQIEYYIRNY